MLNVHDTGCELEWSSCVGDGMVADADTVRCKSGRSSANETRRAEGVRWSLCGARWFWRVWESKEGRFRMPLDGCRSSSYEKRGLCWWTAVYRLWIMLDDNEDRRRVWRTGVWWIKLRFDELDDLRRNFIKDWDWDWDWGWGWGWL